MLWQENDEKFLRGVRGVRCFGDMPDIDKSLKTPQKKHNCTKNKPYDILRGRKNMAALIVDIKVGVQKLTQKKIDNTPACWFGERHISTIIFKFINIKAIYLNYCDFFQANYVKI